MSTLSSMDDLKAKVYQRTFQSKSAPADGPPLPTPKLTPTLNTSGAKAHSGLKSNLRLTANDSILTLLEQLFPPAQPQRTLLIAQNMTTPGHRLLHPSLRRPLGNRGCSSSFALKRFRHSCEKKERNQGQQQRTSADLSKSTNHGVHRPYCS